MAPTRVCGTLVSTKEVRDVDRLAVVDVQGIVAEKVALSQK